MASQKKLQSILNEIRAFCESNADEERAQKYARYFTEGYDAYGLTHGQIYAERDRVLEAHSKTLDAPAMAKLGAMLLQSGKYEEASFALMLIREMDGRFTPDMFQSIGDWLDNGIRNWGHTDCLSGDVLSPYLLENTVGYQAMKDWLNSPGKWKRRAVPVTLILPVKRGRAVKPLLKFVEPLMRDEDRFVQQGLGWFLREAWKKEPEPVEALLLKWKETAARKIYQYATEKMGKEQRERFRRSKKK